MFYVADIIGSLDDSCQLEANMDGLIVFNGADRIDKDGTIDTIEINFCTAPRSNKARISLYIIRAKENNPKLFSIFTHLKPISDLKESIGEQTFKVEIRVERGDYLGFNFDNQAGNPFALERDSYFAKILSSFNSSRHSVSHMTDMNNIYEEPIFTHCVNQGISVCFTIKDTRDIKENIRNKFKQWRHSHSADGNELNVLTTPRRQQLHSSYYSKRLLITFSKIFRLDLTKFQEHDNMLRETSIAQDHWELELEIIKEEERDEIGREKISLLRTNQNKHKYEKKQLTVREILNKSSD
jgi:hypothetical protein